MLWARPTVTSKEREQREIKADLLMAGSQQLGVDAMTVGDGDLAFGLDLLVDGAARYELPYVSANLAKADGSLIFETTRVVEIAGKKVGVTGVIGEGRVAEGVTILAPSEAVRGAVAELRPNVDLVVVLSGLGLDANKALAKDVEGIDLIFSSHTRKMQVDPVIVGTTAIFEAGSRGKYLGEAVLEFRDGGVGWSNEAGRERALRRLESVQNQLDRYDQQIAAATDDRSRDRLERLRKVTQGRYDDIYVPPQDDGTSNVISGRNVPMSTKLADEPGMQALVDAALEKLGPQPDPHAGHDHGPGGGHGADRHGPKRQDTGDYVGATACLGCHRPEYEDWKQTGHGHAYRTLIADKRQWDDDCWSCHVTGAGKPGGPEAATEVGILRNVQCEACHGPGRKHTSDPAGVDLVKAPAEAVCLECHTEEQTEGRFEFDEYLPKIDHIE